MIDVVIVNWNAGEDLRRCVDSVCAFGGLSINQIIVVDNGSTDNSLSLIESARNVCAIRTGENFGFGKACNLGAAEGAADYVLFLNPDAQIYSNTIEGIDDFLNLKSSSNVGICGVQLIEESGEVARSCSRFPSVTSLWARALGLDRVSAKLGTRMSEWDHLESRDVDQVIGAFFLVRREVFDTLGGFDERFFVYFEEVDFSHRARQAGWRSVYLADIQAFHAGGGSSHQVKARRLFYSLRSRLLYARKHFSVPGTAFVLLATLGIEPLTRSILGVAQWSLSAVRETWTAYGMLLRWLPQWLLKGVTR